MLLNCSVSVKFIILQCPKEMHANNEPASYFIPTSIALPLVSMGNNNAASDAITERAANTLIVAMVP